MCAHRRIPLIWVDDLPSAVPFGVTPVLVEVDASTTLRQFNHPKRAMYIFGPEDSSLPKAMIDGAPRVRIPTRGCLNLAATVNIVLYDRCAKAERDAARSAA